MATTVNVEGIEIEIPQSYTLDLSERDAILQTVFDWMRNHDMAVDAGSLAEFQNVYDLEACQAFFDDNFNG